MKVESIEGKDLKDIQQKDENGKNFLKTLLANDGQVEELDDVDLEVAHNPQYVSDYVHEIMEHLRETEVNSNFYIFLS